MNLENDIKNLKKDDKILLNGKYHTILGEGIDLRIINPDSSWKSLYLRDIDDIENKIEEVIPYLPKIRFGGASAVIDSLIVDNGTLVYIDIIGQDQMVKAITSVLLQGKTSQNDIDVVSDKLGIFTINKAGNKRINMNVSDGIVRTIVHHAPSIQHDEFFIITGQNEQELKKSFQDWLDYSQPLGYPKDEEIVKEVIDAIYLKMSNRGLLRDLKTYNIMAKAIEGSVKENEFSFMEEIILEVCREMNLLEKEVKQMNEELPNSPFLTKKQIIKIYKDLEKLPDVYALDGVKIKPVGIKLFSPNMTLYIVESNKESDSYDDKFSRCFGYVENLANPSFSEWGYIDVPAYLELEYKIRMHGSTERFISAGFEQDLYFKDSFIDINGNIGSKEDLNKQ